MQDSMKAGEQMRGLSQPATRARGCCSAVCCRNRCRKSEKKRDADLERTCAATSGVSHESGTLSSCTRLSRSLPEAAAAPPAARRGGRAGEGRAEAEAGGRKGLLGGARKGCGFDGREGEWRRPWRRRAETEVEDDIFFSFSNFLRSVLFR